MTSPLRLLALVACIASMPAWALYKVVGPDGKVTYTDRPPTSSDSKAVPLKGADDGSGGVALPFALRGAADKFPVVLYTTSNCAPCDRGRDLLRTRGVPFQERTAFTDADRSAWQTRVGESQAPVLTVGSQKIGGLAVDQWNSYLDAAGYPRQSLLPTNYRAPSPVPLVAPAASAPVVEAAVRPSAPPPPPPASGIRF